MSQRVAIDITGITDPITMNDKAGRWVVIAVMSAFAAFFIGYFIIGMMQAKAHSWYPPRCCSGHDCRPIMMEDVSLTPNGFFVKESGETISYTDNRIQKTPPEGGAIYHRCSEGGKPEGKTICLYIPNWGM